MSHYYFVFAKVCKDYMEKNEKKYEERIFTQISFNGDKIEKSAALDMKSGKKTRAAASTQMTREAGL